MLTSQWLQCFFCLLLLQLFQQLENLPLELFRGTFCKLILPSVRVANKNHCYTKAPLHAVVCTVTPVLNKSLTCVVCCLSHLAKTRLRGRAKFAYLHVPLAHSLLWSKTSRSHCARREAAPLFTGAVNSLQRFSTKFEFVLPHRILRILWLPDVDNSDIE